MFTYVNDNEDNGAGIAGALKTASVLEQAGIEAKIIELPKATDVDKIDIADYMKGHSVDDFKALMVSSVRLWTYKLSKRKVPVTKLDKRRAFEDFIVDDLKGMPYADWELFVTNDATKHFGLNKKEAKPTIDKVRGSVKEFDFDLDSVSGRNAIYRAFADEYITEHHVKCINGKLRLYKDGVYPDSDEAIEFIQSEIMNIGLSQGVNLAENNIIAILRLIELSTRVRMTECEPDTSSVIVVNNGILHLDTWEIEEFSPDKIYFSKIPVDYVPNAGKPTMFNNYVDSCFKGNEEQKDLLQELFGYSLLKNYKYQNIFYLLGHGGNGKGIALSILGYLLGEHNYASESIHQLTDHLQVDYHVAKLHGKHANICGDISIKTIVNTETIKKLTSNTDPVAARNPYERPFSFVNYAKIIVALNRLPQTDAFTTGDKRRNLIISFNNKFSETDNEIKGLQCVIRDAGEMPGILLWAIEGLKRLEANQKFSDTRTIAQKQLSTRRRAGLQGITWKRDWKSYQGI